MADLIIRPAVSTDVDAIGRIVDRAYAHYVERIGAKPAPMMADYGRLVAKGVVRVIEVETRIAGAIVLCVEPEYVLISNVAVDPDLQGQGLGRELLQHAEAFAASLQLPELRLHTHQLMRENLALYAKLGWEEYHRGLQDGFPRVFMRKALP